MSDWRIFLGNRTPHDGISRLPDPPNWRRFGGKKEKEDAIENEQNAVAGSSGAASGDSEAATGVTKEELHGKTYQIPAGSDALETVNAALYLRRPLLVTGKPGTGKSSLAYAVAYELKLGPVLLWPITTRSTLREGLYRYDAIARLQDAQGEDNTQDIGRYIQLGPLGSALVPSLRPRVLLIDEIDKSDIDLPNDLLNIFEEGVFEIPELARLPKEMERVNVRTHDGREVVIERGRVKCYAFPFVVLTSNGERQFPPAFLRRCLRLTTKEPEKDDLERIVKAHLGDEVLEQSKKDIKKFLLLRDEGDLATDQLLNALYLVSRDIGPVGDERKKLVNLLLKHLTSAEDL